MKDPASTTKYLTITGVLHADNRLVLDPGFLTDQPDYTANDKESALVAELLDDNGKLLLRRPLPFGVPCTDGGRVDFQLVLTKIPFPESTRTIRFILDGTIVHELSVPRESPSVGIRWDPGEQVQGEQRVSWWGEHKEGRELRYLLSYSNDDGKSWKPLSLPTSETEHAVDFNKLPGGNHCRFRVLATDGANTTAALSEAFKRPIQPCYATILGPEKDAIFPRGEPIRFQGQGYYLEEREPELELLEWTSSLDGLLGRGPILESRSLSVGKHEITLCAGRQGRVGSTRTIIRVTHANSDSDADEHPNPAQAL